MENIRVLDIMTRDPIIINPDASLLDCARKMVRKKTKSLIIASNKKIKGFISSRDVLWALVKKSKKDLSKIKAVDISPRKIITIKPSSTIEEAIKKMKKCKFYKLPVVKEGNLVGVITVKDILSFYPELYNELEEYSKIKEQTRKLNRIKKAKMKEVVKQGICEECGNQDTLYRVNGMLICSSCMNSM